MTKKQARKHIQVKVDEISAELMWKVHNHLSDEKTDELVLQFIACFEAYCGKIAEMQKNGNKNAISYIHFSWLRTNIIDKSYRLRIDAYDDNWYADRTECSGEYDASEIFSFLDDFAKMVDIERRGYVYALSAADTKQIVMEESLKYNEIVTSLIQKALGQAVYTSAFKSVLRGGQFSILVGEFHDASVMVYRQADGQEEVIS